MHIYARYFMFTEPQILKLCKINLIETQSSPAEIIYIGWKLYFIRLTSEQYNLASNWPSCYRFQSFRVRVFTKFQSNGRPMRHSFQLLHRVFQTHIKGLSIYIPKLTQFFGYLIIKHLSVENYNMLLTYFMLMTMKIMCMDQESR